MSDDSKIEAKPIGIWPSLQRTARFNQPVETPISIFCMFACTQGSGEGSVGSHGSLGN